MNDARAAAIELLARALHLAIQSHHGQQRGEPDGTVPYVLHPFRVAELVRRTVGDDDPELIAAALLHDVIEDSGARFDEVERACGPRVARIVAELTNDSRLPKSRRHEEMFQRLASASTEARLIKLADRIDNLRHLGASFDRARRERFVEESRRVLAVLEGTCPELERELDELLRTMTATATDEPEHQ